MSGKIKELKYNGRKQELKKEMKQYTTWEYAKIDWNTNEWNNVRVRGPKVDCRLYDKINYRMMYERTKFILLSSDF